VIGFDKIEFASLTDVGVRRSHNQDNCVTLPAGDLAQFQSRGHIFLVADGMGGHAVGELASKLAVDIIPHIYNKHAQEGPVRALRKAFIEANVTIHARGQQNREFEGMGTTATALLLREEGAWIGHVGDSRVYRVRDGQIEQLTSDHSWVWEVARRRRVDPDQVQDFPSNMIMRSLGPEPLVQVDVEGPHVLRQGDVFVVCSDGLSGPLSDREIGAIVTALPPTEACHFLVDLANLQGGPDNITAVVVRLGESDAESTSAVVPRKKGPPWHQRFPWPVASLGLGIFLAVAAIALTVWGIDGGVYIFFLAAMSLLVGLSLLLVRHVREQNKEEDDSEPARIKVYRQMPCPIEAPLLEKLGRAVPTLEQRLRDKQWEADWDTCHEHQKLAEHHQRQGNLKEAFREYCRAMRSLTEALQRQRNKEEVFQPVWEKT
jgi:protein phosphatase